MLKILRAEASAGAEVARFKHQYERIARLTAPHRAAERGVEELAEVARRAAIAIDNARLYRASQEAVRARSEFLTVASHELRSLDVSIRPCCRSRSHPGRPGFRLRSRMGR
ncbi:Signal transduction histidine kinase CheA [Minicystis rosea]|nr:Signal transduction histidine kinase CheA [Minicystis rosea]